MIKTAVSCPMILEFGAGNFGIGLAADEDNGPATGIVFSLLQEPKQIGESTASEDRFPMFVLHFSNIESAEVLKRQVDEMVRAFKKRQFQQDIDAIKDAVQAIAPPATQTQGVR